MSLNGVLFFSPFPPTQTCLLFIISPSVSSSWSWQRVHTLMADLSAPRATQSCPLPSREQGASETHGPPPSSK